MRLVVRTYHIRRLLLLLLEEFFVVIYISEYHLPLNVGGNLLLRLLDDLDPRSFNDRHGKVKVRPNLRFGCNSYVSLHLLNYHLRDGQSQTHPTLVDAIRDREFPKELEEHG